MIRNKIVCPIIAYKNGLFQGKNRQTKGNFDFFVNTANKMQFVCHFFSYFDYDVENYLSIFTNVFFFVLSLTSEREHNVNFVDFSWLILKNTGKWSRIKSSKYPHNNRFSFFSCSLVVGVVKGAISMSVTLNTNYLNDFVQPQELTSLWPYVETAHQSLTNKTGPGNDFLGWVDLPVNYDTQEFARIQQAASKIQSSCDILLVIGIGGSYLGARAAIEFLHGSNYNALARKTPKIYFVGNSLSPDYLNEILALCEGQEICLNVISKSGTTTEPALAFRVLRSLVEQRYGKDGAKERIFCTTDKARGTLKELADREGYETFVIPDDVGGRYSVLTAVGLLPIAVSGGDIQAMMNGAKQALQAYSLPTKENPCYTYAAYRNILSRKGKGIEVLVSYDPAFTMMNEWFKQLFGESEGKDHKGLYPSSMIFSTDLHSLGQFVQDGARTMFETVVDIKQPNQDFFVPNDPENLDGLNFLSNQNMSIINRKAMQGTILAHVEGGVPNMVLEIPDRSAETFGWLVYFFEKACAISGYLLAVNPFDQPGVEDYKKNMFALLGKAGFEDRKAELEAKL